MRLEVMQRSPQVGVPSPSPPSGRGGSRAARPLYPRPSPLPQPFPLSLAPAKAGSHPLLPSSPLPSPFVTPAVPIRHPRHPHLATPVIPPSSPHCHPPSSPLRKQGPMVGQGKGPSPVSRPTTPFRSAPLPSSCHSEKAPLPHLVGAARKPPARYTHAHRLYHNPFLLPCSREGGSPSLPPSSPPPPPLVTPAKAGAYGWAGQGIFTRKQPHHSILKRTTSSLMSF